MSGRLVVANGRPRRGLLWLVIAGLACACRGRTTDDPPPSPEPVEECRQYEVALNACFHRDVAFANQPSLLPKSDDDRQRIKALCAENLQRIKVACR